MHKQNLATAKPDGRLFSWKKSAPATLERSLKAEHGCHENVYTASLDLLNRSYVQLGKLREAFLRHLLPHPLATDIGTECCKLLLLGLGRHAPLGRYLQLTTTAQRGVNFGYGGQHNRSAWRVDANGW